jgi:heptosyltransferase-2
MRNGIVIFALPDIGNFVRCHTVVQLVAAAHPGQPIDIVGRVPDVELAQFMPEIREGVPETFRRRHLDWSKRLELASALRRKRYRAAYVLHTSYRAAIVPFLCGIPERIGWSSECRYPLINRPRHGPGRTTRMVDEIGLLGAARDAPLPDRWPEPQLVVPPQLTRKVAEIRCAAEANRPIIALAPSSSDPRKNWPIENYAELARICVARGCTVWVVGAEWERHLAAAIQQRAHAKDFTTSSVTTLALTLAAADLFVGNDTGPLHIAAAFGKPAVGIFGFWQPFQTAPINAGVRCVEALAAAPRWKDSPIPWPSVDAVAEVVDDAARDRPPITPRAQALSDEVGSSEETRQMK